MDCDFWNLNDNVNGMTQHKMNIASKNQVNFMATRQFFSINCDCNQIYIISYQMPPNVIRDAQTRFHHVEFDSKNSATLV